MRCNAPTAYCTLLNSVSNPHPNLPLRFLHLHRLTLSDKSVGQQTFVPWLAEDVGVENNGVVPFGVACRAGDAAGVAFAVQACAEDLRGAVIIRVDEFGVLRQYGAQIE